MRMSDPCSSKCVAKEWRKGWQLDALLIPTASTATRTAHCIRLGYR